MADSKRLLIGWEFNVDVKTALTCVCCMLYRARNSTVLFVEQIKSGYDNF